MIVSFVYPKSEMLLHDIENQRCVCNPKILEICDCEDGCWKCKDGFHTNLTYDGQQILVHELLTSDKYTEWVTIYGD
jgi:hypothetical protein